MNNDAKNNTQLIDEIATLQQQIKELKETEELIRLQRDLGIALGASSELDEVLQQCTQAAIRASGMDCGGIYLVDLASFDLDFVYSQGLPQHFIEAAAHYDHASAHAQLVMAGEPVYTTHAKLNVPLGQPQKKEALRAIAIVPVRHGNRVVACLNVASHTYEEVPPSSRNTLETIASQIGGAIANGQFQEALRESEAKYATLVEQSKNGVVIAQDNRFVFVNQAMTDITGYAPEELIGMSLLDLVVPEQKEAIVQNIKSRLKGDNVPSSYEAVIKAKTGETITIDLFATIIQFEGKASNMGVISDITKKRQAEHEAQRLRHLLSSIVNSMPSILVAVDADCRVTQWNQKAEEATGISADDAEGKRLKDVYPKLSIGMDTIAGAIRNQEMIKKGMVRIEEANETRFEDVTVYPLVSTESEGAVIRVDDVTQRFRIEEMIIQSEKMLSIGGLAAGMAHEINNPLAGMLQNIQVINNRTTVGLKQNEVVAENCDTTIQAIANYMEQREIPKMIQMIIDSGGRAAKIVENMLNFSRKVGLSRRSTHNLAEILDSTLELASSDYGLKRKYDFREIEIKKDYTKDAPLVPCEITKIQQVCLNILRNGAEAMAEASTPHPRFELCVKKQGDRSVIEITDNGPGMSEEIRKRVFEPFFTTKDIGVGTGLGLSVSYFIITQDHGGTMSVESTPGHGATFIIQLPRERKRTSILSD